MNAMKKIFHRQMKIYRLADNKYYSLIPNLILKSIQVGKTYALIETFQDKKYLVKISQLAT